MAADLDRIDELLSQQKKSVRDAFRVFVASVASETVLAEIIGKLEARDVEGAMAIVDSYIAQMANVIPSIAAEVGAATAVELGEMVSETIPSIVHAISFDPSHPRAAEIVQAHRLEFVTNFTAQQRAATAQAIARGLREGDGATAIARRFRDSIGLTVPQESAVANYRVLLQNRSRDALRRQLRDRRSDAVVERAIANDRPLTDKQIDSMVDRYRRNALQARAETIARTEATQAVGEARDEAVAQMITQTGIKPEQVEETWNATRDTRTRDWHRSMNGQKRKTGEPFIDGLGNRLMRPGDPAAPANTRIACRCAKTFSIIAEA